MIDGTRQICRWHPYPDLPALQQAAARYIADTSKRAIVERGAFKIVLAGGNTPRAIYESLRTSDLAWPQWRVYFGDERCAPPCDSERNSYMALQALFARVEVRSDCFHAIPAERGPLAAAAAYAKTIARAGDFDLVLLGLGEDGHTASLFPGGAIGDGKDSPDVIPVFNAPKPPPARVSLSATRLSRTQALLFIVSGEAKRAAVQRWREGADIPAARIAPVCGVDVMLDAALLRPVR